MRELFDIRTTKSIDKNKIFFEENGEYDFVGRSNINNGVQGKIKALNYSPNPKNTFSLVQVGESVCLFRKNEWYASQNIFILIPLNEKLVKTFKFISSSINKALYIYKSAYTYPTLAELRKIQILLPTKDEAIDYVFMESFVAELETYRIAELEAFLLATGLNDYNLTKDEEELLKNYNTLEFSEFDISSVFDIVNTHSILSNQIKNYNGTIPYLCASSDNNGISSYVEYDDRYLDKGNCIFIGGKTFIVSYQKDDFFSNDSHNLALYYKELVPSENENLLFATCIMKSLKYLYSWGNSVSKTKIKTNKITLPSKNGKVDISMASTLITALKKIVIKDVVLYNNNRIKK